MHALSRSYEGTSEVQRMIISRAIAKDSLAEL
jgi:alkylation response protein AidB-like acyl-CoA dehydrogenase